MLRGYVYKITNITNGKIYVGQTIRSLEKRWKQHIYNARRGSNKPLHKAIQKYGEEKFLVESLCKCYSQSDLNEKEAEYGLSLNALSPNGYSLKLGTGRGTVSEETRKRLSISHIGIQAGENNYWFGKSRLGVESPHYGKSHTQETRQQISKAMKGRYDGENHPQYGTKHTEETKEKQRLKKVKKTYYFISPFGDKVEIKNVRKFCRDNSLHHGHMYAVAQGKEQQHKGWTLWEN